MQRVNVSTLFKLGPLIRPFAELDDLMEAEEFCEIASKAVPLLEEVIRALPLRACRSAAIDLLESVGYIVEANGIPPGSGRELMAKARIFETVLAEELETLDTYLISQKGAYVTGDLVERAETIMPEGIRALLPQKVVEDFRCAGRCLALDNPTASAFHSLRAVEAVLALYFQMVIGGTAPIRMRNWGAYLDKLRKHPDSSEEVIVFLDHLRVAWRNPVAHPEALLSEDDAVSLLGASASAIRQLVLAMEKLEARDRLRPHIVKTPAATA